MRVRAYWWGIILIPETEEEVGVLENIPTKFETKYDIGEAEWVADYEEFNGSNNPSTLVTFPLNKALCFQR